jgi:tetratricopeptide (TPR) repeat protein
MLLLLPKHFRALLVIPAIFFAGTLPVHATPTALKSDAALSTALRDFNLGNYEVALADLNPALEENPNNPEALNLKGAILTKQKKYDEALVCYHAALKAAPDFFPASYNVGALLALTQQWDAAIDYFRNLLIQQPNNELVEYKLLVLLLHQNADPALQAKLFASDLPSPTPGWYYAKATRCYKKGEAKEAEKYLEVAKNIYGDKVEIFQEELDESGLNERKSSEKD